MKYNIQQLHYSENKLSKSVPLKPGRSKNKIAIIIHVFYLDIWEEIKSYLSQLDLNYDLFISVPEQSDESAIIGIFQSTPDIHIYMTENRGRDVLPFLQIMHIIGTDNYRYICKMHTKKTGDSALGNVWRKLLYFDLIGSNDTVNHIIDLFENSEEISTVTGKNTILDSQRYTYGNTEKIDLLAHKTGIIYDEFYYFPAGTMFWARTEIITPMVELLAKGELDFEEEAGQKDNTLAHAIERFFGITSQHLNKKIVESPAQYSKLPDSTLNEVAALVLSQQYVGNDVFLAQKKQIFDMHGAIKFKEQEVQLLKREADRLKEIAESMRIKNRVKNFIPDKVIPFVKKLKKIPTKIWKTFQIALKNPTVVKKIFYYLLRGEVKYLLVKIKEKSQKNIALSESLAEISPSKYFTEFKQSDYVLKDITDIIIPVYNGYQFLEKLFNSIENNTTSPYRLIVINDCSPDEKVKPYLLKRLEKHPTAIFIDHEENQGFLKSVNEAYGHVSNHFLILNTDTEVPKFWLERLMYPIVYMENVASTTPFTNSGEIASFPNFVADNEIFEGMSVESLDAYFREINPEPFYTEVPTGVGFCMGVNYTLTKEIGMFVEDTFGKGYGEENDWCQRAITQGYRNFIVPNLFVYHKHGGSFSAEEKQALLEKNIIKLMGRHPNYGKDVHTYIQKDPHKTLRQLIVLLASSETTPLHLIIDHDLGGGASIYANELVEKYQAEDKNVLYVKYDCYSDCFKLFHHYKSYAFSFKLTSLEDLQALLLKLQVDELFLNSLVSFTRVHDVLNFIHSYIEEKDAKLILPLHDFYTVCPSYTLLNEQGRYCKVPSMQTCENCMQFNMQEWRNYFSGEVNMAKWRESWLRLLTQSNTILCFSTSSQEILLKAYPDIDKNKIQVIPHTVKPMEPVSLEIKESQTITIGILGAINYAKGAQVIKQLVQLIDRDKLDINVVVIGEITELIKSKRFTSTGRYERDSLPSIIQEHHIDIFLIPSIWPETFSYTTQEIMMMEIPLMVFDLGAPAERVKQYEKGYIINEVSAAGVLNTLNSFKNKISAQP